MGATSIRSLDPDVELGGSVLGDSNKALQCAIKKESCSVESSSCLVSMVGAGLRFTDDDDLELIRSISRLQR